MEETSGFDHQLRLTPDILAVMMGFSSFFFKTVKIQRLLNGAISAIGRRPLYEISCRTVRSFCCPNAANSDTQACKVIGPKTSDRTVL